MNIYVIIIKAYKITDHHHHHQVNYYLKLIKELTIFSFHIQYFHAPFLPELRPLFLA